MTVLRRLCVHAVAGGMLAAAVALPVRASSEPAPPLLLTFSYPQSAPPVQEAPVAEDKPALPAAPGIEPNTGRALFEMGVLMTYSQARYWLNYAKFIEDWQFHLSWKDQKRRFLTFDAWMFDSNAFSLNWTHSFAGVLYYQFARTNNWSWPRSFLFTLGGSLWWEYVAEWREIISLNDNIMTSVGGFAAGEAWFQLGKFFIGRKGILNRVLSFVVDPVLKFNHWLDLRQGRNRSLGPEAGWHEFRMFVGQRRMPTSSGTGIQNNLFAGFHTRIVQAPEYGLPGRSDRAVSDTVASDLDVDFALRHGRIEEFNFETRVAGLGRFVREIDAGGRGHAYYLGLGSAFSLFKKKSVSVYDSSAVTVKQGFDLRLDEPRRFTDKMAAVHVLGPVLDYTSFSPESRLRIVLDAYLDFGLVNAFALNPYSAGRDISGLKTTVLYYGYYYGIGTTFGSDVTWRFRSMTVNGRVRYSAYGSIQGLDRFQDEVLDDVKLSDARLAARLETSVRLPWVPVDLIASVEGIRRRGYLRDVRRNEAEGRYSVYVSYVF